MCDAPKHKTNMLTLTNIQPQARTVRGQLIQPRETTNTYNADIVKNESIRLYGWYRNTTKDAIAIERTFRVGDLCEYDSYNLSYTGTIVAIGAKTVRINKGSNGSRNRGNVVLSLHEFAWRNWNFDAERVAAQNAETLNHI